jgi:hypothetical protein
MGLLLVLLLVAVGGAAVSLRESWKHGRIVPTKAMVFQSCTISADARVMNEATCTGEYLTVAMCCFDTGKSYMCSGGEGGTWTILGK